MTSPLQLGFIGLGIMGGPMAGHLLKAGHALHAHTRGSVPAELLAAGASACASAREVAERADLRALHSGDWIHPNPTYG